MASNFNNENRALAAHKYTSKTQETTVAKGVTFAEKSIASQSISETKEVDTVSTKDMTMEEYKQYIYGMISQMTMNPASMNDRISFNISEGGFETMKNDPEYEKWVLNYLQKAFNRYNLESLPVEGVIEVTILEWQKKNIMEKALDKKLV